jgi:hypothetical protein
MRGKGLVGTRVELAGDLLDEVGKYRHAALNIPNSSSDAKD